MTKEQDFSNDKGCLVKGKRRGAREAWLSPDGKWYHMYELGNHLGFAYIVSQIKHPLEKDEWFNQKRYDASNDLLLEDGWIFIQGWWGDIILRGYEHMNKKQYRTLLAVLHETKLFRGWTVRGLWLCKEDVKEDAKTD